MSSAARRAGLLLHPTSLPTGTLGADAHRFVDFMATAGVRVWQVLPLTRPHGDGSPYAALSAHAGHPALIDAASRGDVKPARLKCFSEERPWLDEYAMFVAAKHMHGNAPWWQWPMAWRERDPRTLAQLRKQPLYRSTQIEQWRWFEQWNALKRHANDRGISILGDMPIFVSDDSCEVWSRRDLFLLDDAGRPPVVTGVPPDYFSTHGQRWGNPHYRWDAMERDGFRFWIDRARTLFDLVDLVRIDHFRGFSASYEIPAERTDGVIGRWVTVPGARLFARLGEQFGAGRWIAEDLGLITADVTALRDQFAIPGMRVLQFAFDGNPQNPHLPNNHVQACAAYTGTHDNDTILGWWAALSPSERERIDVYLQRPSDAMPWPLMRAALDSVAELAVLTMQDLLCLGSLGRMNTPSTVVGNWRWRFTWDQVSSDLAAQVRNLVERSGRSLDPVQDSTRRPPR